MEKHQVIIVGAGPAGASCAKALHEASVQALIIEKESLPRYKTCSGVLFGQTQELLQRLFGSQPPEDIYCEPKIIPASQIIEWKHEQGFIQYFWEIPKNGHSFPQNYYNVKRNTFDQWLAEKSGAALRENCLFRGFTVEPGRSVSTFFCVIQKYWNPAGRVIRTGHYGVTIWSELMAAPRQCAGRSRRTCGLQRPKLSTIRNIVRLLTWAPCAMGAGMFFLKKASGKCSAACTVRIIVLCPASGASEAVICARCMETFKGFLRENFKVILGREERVEGCIIKMWPPDLGRDRVLLTGQAGGFIYLNDEGISAAMDSGYRCGMAIARALREGGDALEYYRESVEDIRRHVQQCAEQMHFLVD